MSLSGWRTRSMFDRYNVTSRRDLIEGLERASSGKNRASSAGDGGEGEKSRGA